MCCYYYFADIIVDIYCGYDYISVMCVCVCVKIVRIFHTKKASKFLLECEIH